MTAPSAPSKSAKGSYTKIKERAEAALKESERLAKMLEAEQDAGKRVRDELRAKLADCEQKRASYAVVIKACEYNNLTLVQAQYTLSDLRKFGFKDEFAQIVRRS
jgi:hypothetical protein